MTGSVFAEIVHIDIVYSFLLLGGLLGLSLSNGLKHLVELLYGDLLVLELDITLEGCCQFA